MYMTSIGSQKTQRNCDLRETHCVFIYIRYFISVSVNRKRRLLYRWVKRDENIKRYELLQSNIEFSWMYAIRRYVQPTPAVISYHRVSIELFRNEKLNCTILFFKTPMPSDYGRFIENHDYANDNERFCFDFIICEKLTKRIPPQ